MRKINVFFIFVLLLLLFFIPFGLYSLNKNMLLRKNQRVQSAPSPTISPIPPTDVPTTYYQPPTMTPALNPEDRLMQKIQNRTPLSSADIAAKNRILSKVPQGKPSGTLYESPTILIEYINQPDIFQVQILTTDIQQAKEEAVTWFKSQGLSQEGICNYPVEFYLNFDISNQIKNTGTQFNPLPPGC